MMTVYFFSRNGVKTPISAARFFGLALPGVFLFLLGLSTALWTTALGLGALSAETGLSLWVLVPVALLVFGSVVVDGRRRGFVPERMVTVLGVTGVAATLGWLWQQQRWEFAWIASGYACVGLARLGVLLYKRKYAKTSSTT